jgi:hypothetical protein
MNITHVTDPQELAALVRANAREGHVTVGDAEAWLRNPRNFALRSGGDLSLFEAIGDWPGPLKGHVFFASRGKDALKVARAMLRQAFDYGATAIYGETPLQFRDALMFARLLGFKPYAVTEKATLTRLDANPLAGSDMA